MMLKPITVFFIIALSLFTTVQAKIYSWVDEQGVSHFSDQPRPGATELKVKVTPPVTTGPLAVPRKAKSKADSQTEGYQLSMISPKHESTIRSNEGSITVEAKASASLTPNLGYRVLLDGIPQGSIQKSSTFKLSNVDRGEHTVTVQLVDNNGKVIASTDTVTLFLLRANNFFTPKVSIGAT